MDVNLVLFKKSGATKSFHLSSSLTIIGRRQECDLCIPLMIVSRRHCELNQDKERLKIRDLGSRNGTFINGRRVDEAEVKAGDKVQIGPLTFTVQIDQQPAELTTSDMEILQPPEHALESEKQADEQTLDQGETLAARENADMAEDVNVAEMLEELREELGEDNDF